MRLKAVAPGLFVEPLADTEIAGIGVPAATKLILLTRQRVDSTSAADARRALTRAREQPDQKAFLAFGAGPRFCPGRNLAFLESTSAMAMIARNFEVTLDPSGGPVTEHLSFTMVPQGPAGAAARTRLA